jgi:hypothetical protein
MWGIGKASGLMATALCLALPAAAQGTVTIGSNLGRAPNYNQGCSPDGCTFQQVVLPSGSVAPGGLASPVHGTVVTWRIRTGSGTDPAALRVLRPIGGGSFLGAGRSSEVIPLTDTVSAYPTNLPIAAGDAIGLDCCATTGEFFVDHGGDMDYWNPVLPEGTSGAPGSENDVEMAINADIEPTSALAIGEVKSGKGGKVTVTVTLPNPGTLQGGDKRDAGLASAAGKRKPNLLKRVTAPVGVAGQTIRMLLRPSKRARALLRERGRLKAKAKVVFTPTGGSASSQTVKVKLKR